jgi:hypothetical protein
MAKANQFARANKTMHSKTDTKYKIPFEDRKAYIGNNTEKWVSKKTYQKYRRWVKEGRPERK